MISPLIQLLHLKVKAVLEEKSPKYQSVMTFGDTSSTLNTMKKNKEENGLKIGFLNNSNSSRPSKPVIVPTAVKKVAMKKNTNNSDTTNHKILKIQKDNNMLPESEKIDNFKEPKEIHQEFKKSEVLQQNTNISQLNEKFQEIEEPVKRGRGRPKKVTNEIEKASLQEVKEPLKRGRGRPISKLINYPIH